VQKLCYTGILLSMSFFAGGCFSQSKAPESTSLCSLQRKAAEGSHKAVHVSGIFSEGLERGTLEDAACPKDSTWVELDLRSDENKEKLRKMLHRSRRAYVVVEGEFYGPPVPDSKLPEAIRKSYHPGWGHLAAFKTKLVVRAIREVKAVPADHTKVENTDSIDPQTGNLHLTVPLAATAIMATSSESLIIVTPAARKRLPAMH
jgi:hypothetical protein